MEFDWNLLLLVGAGFVAGVVNTFAGGGSLLTLPVLIFMGLPAAVANGTNRISILLQTLSSSAGFYSKGVNTFPFSIWLAIPATLGAVIGARIAIDLPESLFNKILAFVMIAVVIYLVSQRKRGVKEVVERLSGKHLWVSMGFFFIIGIYGGFIQAGTGFLILLVLSMVNRMSLVKSNAVKVFVVFIFNIGALLTFALAGDIKWSYGLVMSIGSASGAWLASRWAVDKGDKLVKIFLVIMVLAMATKLWFFST
ncbi:sulfite exporter TauE/SafE family protein [Gilvibacter sp.]|uniref:sulfite exporter TauE/SafE family protein n=1 Tax=Gilvibacter sp. TaxID=2729997 RepID=UPI0025BDD528|nr:sulfite exporter TauE/SafE family protein [Gilvibacter sp.]NQX78101.1 sulfite exporter TauE/SafE family protein [Gilvibacter sp.]